jgi:hypothetical protein
MLRTVHADVFQTELDVGRTKPVILGGQFDDGTLAGEFVVKLRSEMVAQAGNSSFEAFGVLLAQHFDIATPEAVCVEIDPRLADSIPPKFAASADRIRRSAGPNFGTRYLTGYRTWPTNQTIPQSLQAQALDLFAFDALIQNPDRGAARPNLLTGNGRIIAIDHDSAFSFVHAILGPVDPCSLHLLPFLEQHVFFSQLRGRHLDLEHFRERLLSLDQRLPAILSATRPAWEPSYSERIESHLMAAREKADRFMEAIAWRLAK